MWSNVEEKITDGASGLAPKSQPPVVFVGASSRGTPNTPYVLGKAGSPSGIIGYGSCANAVRDCQKNMADVSILAVRSEGDIPGEIGAISKSQGAGNAVASGEPLFSATVEIEALSSEEVRITLGGDKASKDTILIPEDKTIALEELGLSLLLPAGISAGDKWSFTATTPSSSREALKKAVNAALEIYTPEAVIICQDSTAEDAAYWGAEAESYFDNHKPVLFILQTALAEGKIDDAITSKIKEFAKTDARFVSILCQPGTVIDGSIKHKRQPLGFLAATLTKAAVCQSIGATRWFAVPNFAFPEGWTNESSRALDEARFITLRSYAGLNGIFWANGRTLAGDTSDYRFIEIVRTVHRAVRLARRASLPYMHAPGDTAGIKNLLAEIRSALDKMTGANPAELVGFEVEAPEGQDVVNKGLQVELSLYGVPIIRKIVLNFSYSFSKAE